jgi:hypothetical protein
VEKRTIVGRGVAGGEAAHPVGKKPAIETDPRRAEPSRAVGLSAPTLVDFGQLYRKADSQREQYRNGDPFPHILLEDFLPRDVVRRALAEFPDPESDIEWRQVNLTSSAGQLVQRNKLGFAGVNELGETLREVLWELNSGTFLRYLELLTGIEGLIADPMMQGGGIHQVLPGGMLAVHADFTRHRRYNLDRRLNVLVYLNEEWPADWAGELELWTPQMDRCARRIRPLAGRCVIFNTTADSFHGHPRPLACPDGMSRKSIALYYYTCGRDDAEVEPTDLTSWREVPAIELPAAE